MLCGALAAVAQAQNGSFNKYPLDVPQNRMYPAGPGTRVSLNSATLETLIPLQNLKGPGHNRFDLAVYHESPTAISAINPYGDNYIAPYWRQSFEWIMAPISGNVSDNDGIGVFHMGQLVYRWVASGLNTYVRAPGCRADLTVLTSGGNVIGYQVLEQASKDALVFSQHATNGWYYISSRQDAHGNKTTFNYNGASLLQSVVDPAGRSYSFAHNVSGNAKLISSITLTAGTISRTWDFTYGSFNTVTAINFPPATQGGIRKKIQCAYNGSNPQNLTDLYDFNGNHWQYEYANNAFNSNAVVKVHPPLLSNGASADPNYWLFQYSAPLNQPLTVDVIDLAGNDQTYVFSTTSGEFLGLPIAAETGPSIAADSGNRYSDLYTWRIADNTLATWRDKNGNTTTYVYDANNHGDLLNETNPLNQTKSYLYDSLDRMVSEIWPALAQGARRNRTTFGYNIYSDRTSETLDPVTDAADGSYSNPNGASLTTSYGYNAKGNRNSEQKPGLNGSSQTYDVYGNLTVDARCEGMITYTADAVGNRRSETLGTATTTYAYDGLDRLVLTTFPDGKTIQRAYDPQGNETQTINENGWKTTRTFDPLNRLLTKAVQVAQGKTETETFTYDPLSQDKTAATSPGGKVTRYAWNETHRLVQIAYPDGTTRKYHYTPDGLVDKSQDGKGNLTTYVYDAANRLVQRQTVEGSNTYTVSNYYRADGLRYRRTDWWGPSDFFYDTARRLIYTYQAAPAKYVVDYFDASTGLKNAVQILDYFGNPVQTWIFTYDGCGRRIKISQTPNGMLPVVSSITYAGDQPSQIVFGPNDRPIFTIDYTYDGRGRPTLVRQTQSGSLLESLAYTYDGVGNPLTLVNSLGGGFTSTLTATFDGKNRVLSEVKTGAPSGHNFNRTYTYDPDGNRLTGPGGSATYDSNNRLLTYGSGISLTYDANSQPITFTRGSETSSLTWYGPQMFIASSNLHYSQNIYDGDGRRVFRQFGSSPSNLNGIIAYIYDGDELVGEESGVTGSVFKVHMPGFGYAILGFGEGYYFNDPDGSVYNVVNNRGQFIAINEYDRFGNLDNYIGGLGFGQNYRSRGGFQLDEDYGWLARGRRLFMPMFGRYLNPAPDSDSILNLFTDPLPK
ncbi:MAG: RHS repeat protein [Armatimonadetes bacterium]|nr:RHS repeat protein [Armatimonadota bacterium]